MRTSSQDEDRPRRDSLTMDQWLTLVAADERRAVSARQAGRGGRQTLLEYYDAANEDSEGRLPHEPGYCGRWEREVKELRRAMLRALTPSEEEILVRVRKLVAQLDEAA